MLKDNKNRKERFIMKKVFKKGVSVSLALILSVGLLSGCGGKDEAENVVSDEAILNVDENAPVTISIGQWPTREGKDMDRMNKRKEEFEKLYPNITIEPDTWKYDVKTFYPKAQAGLLPTVFDAHFTELEKLKVGGYVADLTAVLEKENMLDKLNPQLRELLTKDGRLYALPMNAYVHGLAYNTDLFEKAGYLAGDGTPTAPKTWDEVREFAKQIKEKTGVAGFAIPTINNCGGWMFSEIAWSYGVDFMEQQEDGSWKATFDSPECVEALQLIKDMKWVDKSMPENGLIGLDDYYQLYGSGQVGMIIGANDGIANAAVNYEMNKDHVGMVDMPSGPSKKVGLLGGALKCIAGNSTPEQIVAAVKWIEFLGITPDIGEEAKVNSEEDMKSNAELGKPIGGYTYQVWTGDSEKTTFALGLVDKYRNVNVNHFKLYNDSMLKGTVEIQPEEPVECQSLYAILDSCIQSVLTDENADCAKIVKEANEEFQTNVLDNLEY